VVSPLRLATAAPLLPLRSQVGYRSCCAWDSNPVIAPASVPSLAPSCFFSPSLHRRYAASLLLRPLLTSPPLSRWRSPRVRCRICPLVPPGSTQRVLMTFGLRCSQPACRPRRASLPVRIPAVESLLRASFGFGLAAYALRFATVAVIGSGWLLSSNETLPMPGTLGQVSRPARGVHAPRCCVANGKPFSAPAVTSWTLSTKQTQP
jgi:hypothetical protein